MMAASLKVDPPNRGPISNYYIHECRGYFEILRLVSPRESSPRRRDLRHSAGGPDELSGGASHHPPRSAGIDDQRGHKASMPFPTDLVGSRRRPEGCCLPFGKAQRSRLCPARGGGCLGAGRGRCEPYGRRPTRVVDIVKARGHCGTTSKLQGA
jgi:hypothetical protein